MKITFQWIGVFSYDLVFPFEINNKIIYHVEQKLSLKNLILKLIFNKIS